MSSAEAARSLCIPAACIVRSFLQYRPMSCIELQEQPRMDRSTIQRQLAGSGNELTGLRLLVVEDDYLVAVDLCSSLRRRGACIVGPAGNIRRGRELIRQEQPD